MQAVLKSRPAPGFTVGDVAEPEPGAGEVLLRVAATSVCGTDVHLYDWNAWAQARVVPPRVMGHEVSGEVIAWGDGVRSPALGTRVAVESHIVCGHCEECRRGDFHVCENTRILGVHVDGAFATYIRLAAAGGDIDCALEMSGSAIAVASATRLVRPGGWIALLGIGDAPDVIDLSNDVVMKGLSLYGVVGRKLPSTWERTTAYVRDGVI